ncbi:hypothetical protein Bwad001_27880 [Bilophila wadsworthia]
MRNVTTMKPNMTGANILIIYPIFHKFINVSDRVNARKQSEIEAGVRCLILNPDK